MQSDCVHARVRPTHLWERTGSAKHLIRTSRPDRWPQQPTYLFTPRPGCGDQAHMEPSRLRADNFSHRWRGEARLCSIRTASSLRLRFTGQCLPLTNAEGALVAGVT